MVAVCIFISQPPTESVYESILAALQQNHPSFVIYVLLINPIDSECERYMEKFCSGLPNVHFYIKQWQGSTYKLLKEGLNEKAEYIFALNGGNLIGEGCLKSAVRSMKESDLALVQFAPAYWGTCKLVADASQESQSNLYTHILKVESLDAIEDWTGTKTPDWEELDLRLNRAGYKTSFKS